LENHDGETQDREHDISQKLGRPLRMPDFSPHDRQHFADITGSAPCIDIIIVWSTAVDCATQHRAAT
jgi:hypothetical protein